MSALSDFLPTGKGGGVHLGYIDTADGSFVQVAKGAGVAYVDYASEDVQFSTDGSTTGPLVGEGGYIQFTSNLYVKKDGLYRFALALTEA